MSLIQGWILLNRIGSLVQTLTREYQVVLVVSAGEDLDESYGDTGVWPSRFASDYDMITVGAVQSEGGDDFWRCFAWSAGGDAVSVSGPGNGLRAYLADELYTVEGASFANAVVSGLVAYLLSIQALQRHFQNQPNLPVAVRDYVVSMSSQRYEAQRSVWNGLDYANPSTMFDDLQIPNSKNPNAPKTPYPVWKGIPRPSMIEWECKWSWVVRWTFVEMSRIVNNLSSWYILDGRERSAFKASHSFSFFPIISHP